MSRKRKKKNNDYQEPRFKSFIAKDKPDDFFKRAINLTTEELIKNVDLASTKKELLLMQSLQGRAMQGAWAYSLRKNTDTIYYYPNTTNEDIFQALDLHVGAVHKDRQKIITDISTYIKKVFTYMKETRKLEDKVLNGITDPGKLFCDPKKHCAKMVTNQRGINGERDPLGGIKFLEYTLINKPLDFLIGAYIGGCIDSAEWRARTEDKYKIKLHQGVCMPVHVERARKKGYTLSDLANMDAKSVSLEQLENENIVSKAYKTLYSSGYVSGFIQLQKGYGVSDDAAFISTALLFGLEAACGLLLIDAIDTWDKSTAMIIRDGQDEVIGQGVKKTYEDTFKEPFPCTEDDVMKVIYLSAINSENHRRFPSSSQRRFVQIDKTTGLHAIESHVLWIKSVKEGGFAPPAMDIAFKQVPNTRFYSAFKQRYDVLLEQGEVPPYVLPPNGNET
ncbi:MAG: hypothetical protein KKF46_06620 [Nanoarchaeota archaeon]|nr:hypothetical protein [Nanoarchaeota archaeon]MBU1322003.1 hypothetical protein [Nanoarchaeota archaeon]MBU1598088.1 hypothetical protein [Nanoarchaeota archaeon]MBU2441783.1 hypothetical protein [Nanoarchaeota archaeon]